MTILGKLKALADALNSQGIPLPMMRDPKTKAGSVSFTMVAVSFGVMILSILMALALAVNKWARFFDTDATALNDIKEAFWMALSAAGLSTSLYFGRKFQKDATGAMTSDKSDDQNTGK